MKSNLFITAVVFITLFVQKTYAKSGGDFYQILIYQCTTNEQVQKVDEFLQNAWLPGVHRAGVKNVGVFKPINNDTARVKEIYLLLTFQSASQWRSLSYTLANDIVYQKAGKLFLNASANEKPFERMESILLTAFEGQPHLKIPKSKDTTRIFELRSYESPTQELFNKKMTMFNKDEIKIFNRLGFNPVFYGAVESGGRMPNLMYMPVFQNVNDRDEQWKVFGGDPKWKQISSDPKNENNVSVNHIDSILMHSVSYSDY